MRLTDLLGLRVATESGEALGRVHDVRVRRDPRSASERAGQRWELEGLVVGRRGVLERLGLPGARRPEPILPRDTVPWSAIVRIRGGTAVVRDGTELR